MSQVETLQARRAGLMRELAGLVEMRRGSLVEQYVETVKSDGSKGRRGPYVLYSFKEKGKTVSRRLTVPGQVPIYRKQIQAFRRFEQVVSELTSVSERLCDLALSDAEDKKKR
jgi:hypothetical protein